MVALLCFLLVLFASPFKSKSRLEAADAALRHQLAVLRRKVRGRLEFTNSDQWFFVQLYRWFPSILQAIAIVRPETLVRWHRAGFRRYWRWKSRSPGGGRPQVIPQKGPLCMSKTQAFTRAEALFAKQQKQKTEGEAAWVDYQRKQENELAKTARLRKLRLERQHGTTSRNHDR
jgi:hypothetical protein